MDKQLIINAISVLSLTIDSLNRAEDKDTIAIIVNKILELVNQL